MMAKGEHFREAEGVSPSPLPAIGVSGPTILLGSGNYFSYVEPERSLMSIEDLAYGLGCTGRFAGQCVVRRTGKRRFYSVAQHSTGMSHKAPRGHRRAALLHETGEGTCGDLTTPLKKLCPDYKSIEKHCARAGLARFGVVMSDPSLIKHLDLRMLATERRDLMPWNGERWETVGDAQPFDEEIVPIGPEEAAEAWLARWHELTE